MRIPCPFCGERQHGEFSYRGDAALRHPALGTDDEAQYYAAAYLRDNPAGPHEELWYHGFGCRSWVIVTRNTVTHEILAARLAQPVTAE